MARNRSTNRRRRRGRFSFLMKLLCILLIAGAVVAALTVFFKVQSITVSGNARYTSEEVVAASGQRNLEEAYLFYMGEEELL